jgi:putative ABC transport system substrate-binding protein
LIQGLHDLGWIAGTNLTLDIRHAESSLERGALLTREMLALKPNVFVSGADAYARAAMAQDTAVPIVFIVGNDPVGLGLVKSLATPGGNATGFSVLNYEFNAKRLALLKEAVPGLRKVGLLFRRRDATAQAVTAATEQAGRRLGVAVLPVSVQGAEDFAPAFERMAEAGADGVMNVPDPLFLQSRRQLAELALAHRMAAAFGASEFGEAGMLLGGRRNISIIAATAGSAKDLRINPRVRKPK